MECLFLTVCVYSIHEMSQIRNIIVAVIALIIVSIFVLQSRRIGAPIISTFVAALAVILILWNVARRSIRGY